MLGHGAHSYGTSPAADSFFAEAMDNARGRHRASFFSDGAESRPIVEVDEDALGEDTDEAMTEASSSAFSGRPGGGGRPHQHLPALTPLTPRARSPQALAALQPPGEATPLLAKHEEEATEVIGRRAEAAVLVSYALPILGTHLLEYSVVVTSVVSLGHLGANELAAGALGNLTINVIALGMCTALDTLCSQAFKSNPEQAGLHTLRTVFLLAVAFVPQWLFCRFSETLLLGLGQDAAVAHLAGSYLRTFVFAIPGYNVLETTRRWLQGQGLLLVPTCCLVIGAPLNLVLNLLLVWGPDWARIGFLGAPWASVISFTLMGALSLGYCVFFAPRTCWAGWPSAKTFWAYRGFRDNIRFGCAGILMVGSEWWAWECVSLGTAYLGPQALAAQSVLLSTASLVYQLPFAIGSAAAVRVGNLLGAGLPTQARMSSMLVLVIALVVGVVNSSLVAIFRRELAGAFTSDPAVRALAASIFPLVALFQVADTCCGICSGVLRGAGRAPIGAVINLGAYWLLALPLGFLIAFGPPLWGLQGLWIGLTIGVSLSAVATVWFVLQLDYAKEAHNARSRMLLDAQHAEAQA